MTENCPYHEIVSLKQRSVGAPMMLVRKAPKQYAVNIRITEVQCHYVIICVSTRFAVFDFNIQFSDPQRNSSGRSDLNALLEC